MRVYRPVGAGPFPALLDLHGGAWNNKDRTANEPMDRAIAESGVPNYWTYSWNVMVLPAKTPPSVVTRINKEINRAIATPEIQKRFKDLIMEPRTGTPDELQKMYETDVTMWRRIITEAKIQPN